MVSPLAALSADARNHVLNFLPLRDCLRYSQVSKQSLADVLPNLRQRRAKQIEERLAYQRDNAGRFIPANEILKQEISLVQSDSIDQSKVAWHFLPSAAERLKGLYRALPQSHTGKDLARQLMFDTKKNEGENDNGDEENISADDVPSCLQLLQGLSKAHRIHDQLLSQSTIHSRPPTEVGAGNVDSLSVTLDQYMGDVLIATYLMSHSIAGLVEGNPNHNYTSWTAGLEAEARDTPESINSGYRQWIYMHSTILRTLPQQTSWLNRMKLYPICGERGETVFPVAGEESVKIEFMYPPLPFLNDTHTNATVNLLKVLAGPRRRTHWSHSTRLADFGPLGPAFRGRDDVRFLSMTPGNILKHLGMFNALCRATGSDRPPKVLTDVWLTRSEEESEWMLCLSKECYRNRPMTVQPPLVTISAFQEYAPRH